MEENLNKIGASNPEDNQEKMSSLKNELQTAEQAGNEAEVLRLEGEIRDLEQLGNESLETVEEPTVGSNEAMTSVESLPSKEDLQEEIAETVEDVMTQLTEKEPKFYSEKAKMLLGRLGQVAGTGVAAAGAVGIAAFAPDLVETAFKYGPMMKDWHGNKADHFDFQAVMYAGTVISMLTTALGATGVLAAQEGINKIKRKMESVKSNFRSA